MFFLLSSALIFSSCIFSYILVSSIIFSFLLVFSRLFSYRQVSSLICCYLFFVYIVVSSRSLFFLELSYVLVSDGPCLCFCCRILSYLACYYRSVPSVRFYCPFYCFIFSPQICYLILVSSRILYCCVCLVFLLINDFPFASLTSPSLILSSLVLFAL